jgi:hypothetical protein
MILLDLLQCLFCIVVIDLFSTFVSNVVLFCNSLVMFVIYFWIKIKLKVILFPTIQKLYCSHFSFMAGFVDALRPLFIGMHFKRWQVKAMLSLTTINVFWVSKGKPEGKLTAEQEKAYGQANTIFVGVVIGVLKDHL